MCPRQNAFGTRRKSSATFFVEMRFGFSSSVIVYWRLLLIDTEEICRLALDIFQGQVRNCLKRVRAPGRPARIAFSSNKIPCNKSPYVSNGKRTAKYFSLEHQTMTIESRHLPRITGTYCALQYPPLPLANNTLHPLGLLSKE